MTEETKDFEQYKKDTEKENETSFKELYEKTEEFEKKLDEITSKVLKQGQLIIVAQKQMGKTNCSFWLMRTLMKRKEHELNKYKTLIFDLPLVWRFRYDRIPYIDYSKITSLPIERDLIIDIPYADSVRTRNSILEILMEDFVRKRRLKEKFEGDNPFLNVYVIEEMQNVWGTYDLSGNIGRFGLKIFSEAMNYGMVIIGITQRLADVSTKIIGRARYLLIGNLNEDNDIRKITRIANKQIAEKVKTLRRGEFIFLDRENPDYIDMVYFPKFDNEGKKPYPYQNGKNGSGYVKKIFLSS